jgi:hypothetical protein
VVISLPGDPMRRVLPIVLLAFILVCPSLVIGAVECDNSINEVLPRNAVDTYRTVEVLTLLVLTITAIAIIWYSYETRKLRIATENTRTDTLRTTEIEYHPWLVGSDLKIDDDPHIFTPSIWLPVKNVGKTPAFIASIICEYYLWDDLITSETYRNQIVPPNDVLHFKIVSIKQTSGDPGADRISVAITYSTHLKGSGIIKHEFGRVASGWENLKSEYTIALSTGEKYPK